MTSVTFRYKGSSKSGNYAHAGRQGKVGGSTPKSVQAMESGDGWHATTDVNTVTMRHYTSQAAANSIKENGFRLSSNSMYGQGVYFSDTPAYSDSETYLDVSLKPHKQLVVDKDIDAENVYREVAGTAPWKSNFRQSVLDAGYGSVQLHSADESNPWIWTLVLDPSLIKINSNKALHFRYKGSSKSGNYGHAGIPGHLGGSAPKAFRIFDVTTPAGRKEASDFISANQPSDLTKMDRRWREEYSSQNYQQLNGALRYPRKPDPFEYDKKLIAFRDGMDSMISKGTIPEDVTLWRGMPMKDIPKPGDIVEEKGYSSTSLGKEYAAYFTSTSPSYIGERVLMEIRTPAGTHAAFATKGRGEAEAILPRSSKFKIISVEPNQQFHLDSKYIGGAAARDITYTSVVAELVNDATKEMIKFRYKGSSTSGNHMHAGRPGKVGGSAPVRRMVQDQYDDYDKMKDIASHADDYSRSTQTEIHRSLSWLDKAKTTHMYGPVARAQVQQTFDQVYKEDVAQSGESKPVQPALFDIENTPKPRSVVQPPSYGSGDSYVIAGKTAKDWKAAGAELSAKGRDDLAPELKKAGVADADASKYLDRLEQHRAGVMAETFAIASSGRYKLDADQQKTLVRNLLHHDTDKYDPALALGYINKAHDNQGFWDAIRSHHSAASHHPEYYIQPGTHGKRADRMPYPEAIEMLGDWVATARAKGSPIDAYYKANKNSFVLHPDTRALAERELEIAVQAYGGKEMTIQFRYKGSSKSGNYGHAGRRGKVGGSAPSKYSGEVQNVGEWKGKWTKPATQVTWEDGIMEVHQRQSLELRHPTDNMTITDERRDSFVEANGRSYGANKLVITKLHVAESARGRGVATELVKTLIENAPKGYTVTTTGVFAPGGRATMERVVREGWGRKDGDNYILYKPFDGE